MWRTVRQCGLAIVCATAAVCYPASQANAIGAPIKLADLGFVLKLPISTKVAFQGQVDDASANETGGAMLYPAPSFIGLLVGIATHGAIVGAEQSRKQSATQKAADQVLEPFKPVLDDFLYSELVQRGVSDLGISGPVQVHGLDQHEEKQWVVESQPLFILSQDKSVLILENTVAVYAADAPKTQRYTNVIKVVSPASTDADLAAMWSANQGEALKQLSTNLFTHSLALALRELDGSLDATQHTTKTFRYTEGNIKRMERAELLLTCNRSVVRTLRGWLVSVPNPTPATPLPSVCETMQM